MHVVTPTIYPSNSGMSKGVKVGIIVGGAIAFFLGLSFLALLLFIKRKAKQVDDMEQQQEPSK